MQSQNLCRSHYRPFNKRRNKRQVDTAVDSSKLEKKELNAITK